MKLFVSLITGIANLAICCSPAHGQIFGGVSDTGAVVLSNIQSTDAKTLIVLAPLSPALVLAVMSGAPAPLAYAAASNAFLSFIEEASSAYRLPAELIHAVIAVESNYNPRAVS